MAATGYTPISLYYSTTASATPTAGNLVAGELALNTTDEKLYFKNASGTVKLLASNSSSSGTVSSVAVSGGTTGLTTSGGPITTSGTITLAGTLATTNGGTGLTSFTSGGVVYASSSSALATGSALTFDGTNLGLGVTPSAWQSAFKALQVGSRSAFYQDSSSATALANNIYNDGTNRYIATAASTIYLQETGAHKWFNAPSGTAGNAITFTQAMTLDASGNLGLGTTSPTTSIYINGAPSTASISIQRSDEAGYGGRVGCGNTIYGPATTRSLGLDGYSSISIGIAGTEKIRISSSGGMGLGTTADPGAGAIYATGNITAYYSSDIKFKENVRDIPNALATVNAIGGKLFDWTDEYIESKGGADGYFVQKADFGVVAQDVQKVFPIAVRTREDGSLAVDYEKLGALAFAALVELTKRVEALEAK